MSKAAEWITAAVPWADLRVHLLFALGCAVLAGVLVFVDRTMLKHTGRSLLDVTLPRGWKGLWDLLGWCGAAGIVGGLASGINVLQPTVLAAVTVAVGWPIIYEKIVEIAKTPVQQPTEEGD